ncbi:DNA-processing protein DprA [Lewinella sp. 4G2]|uniref:DNA-processing protein DprA n=1 Tax=Lewinella sp. 4G2 TaxID=1803372 RepID=UPI0007B4AF51|nr:DNA-processing protein DprA [Lewinella sp. 4G2]OAV42841.1 DNA protecting protein DprA [Lewinella sp. 4G2]
MHSDTHARVALSRVPGIGAKLFRSLIHHFTSADDVLRARPQELCEVEGVAERTAHAFTSERHLKEADAILHHAEKSEVHILCCVDDDYPGRLAKLAGSPPILYHLGQTDLQNKRTAAVVGTREMSSRGSRQIDLLLDPLAEYDPLIVSGLAYGVDIYAHRRCLQIGLPTLGVMGSGFGHVYPAAHARTALKMVEAGGGILTEYPYWMKPNREHFPARNRIVAAQSDVTVVVESATRGGSMITARMAHDMGRKVGACPGRGGDPLTAGCNALIKKGKAHLIEEGQDLIDLMKWKGAVKGTQRRLFDDLSAAEQQLVSCLRDQEAVDIDTLHHLMSEPPARLAGTLLMLEMKGHIVSLPGHRYRLAGG